MEEYREYLYGIFGSYNDQKYDTLLETIKHDKGIVHVEEDLTSKYVDDHYEPAVIYNTTLNTKCYFWLFDGKIRDWEHPFSILAKDKHILSVEYYSSERIESDKPILVRWTGRNTELCYNRHPEYKNGLETNIRYTNTSVAEYTGILPGEIFPKVDYFMDTDDY